MLAYVAGISLIYFLCLVFAIYQKYDDVKEVMYWLYPDLRDWKPDEKVNSTGLVFFQSRSTLGGLVSPTSEPYEYSGVGFGFFRAHMLNWPSLLELLHSGLGPSRSEY